MTRSRPALSTMWSQLRHGTLAEFIVSAQSLGFPEVELSHIVTEAMLDSLPRALWPTIRILHHPCPNPGSMPDLCDPDDERREAAVAAARHTIRWAARLGAKVMVTHLGMVGVDLRWENAIRARWLQDEADTPAFRVLIGFVAGLRAAQAPRYLNAARRSLAELAPFARKHGVRIALENGEWVMAMPNLEEARILLSEFEPAEVGLWVDTGHATIQERVGFDSLMEWIKLDPSRLLGLHYHDVAGLRDHLVPGNGTIDWRALAALIPSHALPTCEFDWYYTPEEIAHGAERLAIFGLTEELVQSGKHE